MLRKIELETSDRLKKAEALAKKIVDDDNQKTFFTPFRQRTRGRQRNRNRNSSSRKDNASEFTFSELSQCNDTLGIVANENHAIQTVTSEFTVFSKGLLTPKCLKESTLDILDSIQAIHKHDHFGNSESSKSIFSQLSNSSKRTFKRISSQSSDLKVGIFNNTKLQMLKLKCGNDRLNSSNNASDNEPHTKISDQLTNNRPAHIKVGRKIIHIAAKKIQFLVKIPNKQQKIQQIVSPKVCQPEWIDTQPKQKVFFTAKCKKKPINCKSPIKISHTPVLSFKEKKIKHERKIGQTLKQNDVEFYLPRVKIPNILGLKSQPVSPINQNDPHPISIITYDKYKQQMIKKVL